jgi:glutamate dehydrogenase
MTLAQRPFVRSAAHAFPQDELKALEEEVRETLQHVSTAVSDYREMTAAASNLRRDLLTHAEFLPVSEENVAESIEFIGWLVDNHFTFLGYEKYRITTRKGESILQLDSDSLLGVSQLKSRLKSQTKVASLPGAAADFIDRPKLLSFAKSSMRSKVHRPAYYDYVLIKEFDRSGRVTHMHRFLGLYTSSVYFREALAIPLLRKKVSRALEKSGFIPNGHNMKDLLQVINTFPRDELFQISSSQLLETAVAITRIRDTGSSRIFIRKDFYGRFISCLVYIPRELFNTNSRLAIQALLEEKFQAQDVDFNTYLSESSQARSI